MQVFTNRKIDTPSPIDYTTVPAGLVIRGHLWTGQSTVSTVVCPKCGRVGVASSLANSKQIIVHSGSEVDGALLGVDYCELGFDGPGTNLKEAARDTAMLLSINGLQGYRIHATDGLIGQVEQFYFDDEAWTVRYLVVDTGHWLTGRRVLISPIVINEIDQKTKAFNAGLTQEQIKNSPDIDTHRPVSRQHEAEYFNYYGWPYYWYGGDLWGGGYYPNALTMANSLPAKNVVEGPSKPSDEQVDSHLRSTGAVTNYHIEAADGEIGHVEDFIMDDHTWTIRYLVVNTHNWWPGKRILVPPQWIKSLSWGESKVYVNLDRESIKSAPQYKSSSLITHEFEQGLYGHSGRPGYWDMEPIEQNGNGKSQKS